MQAASMIRRVFVREAPRCFLPPPAPQPQRTLSKRPANAQNRCSFLTKLPAEIRNEIYGYVFGTEDAAYLDLGNLLVGGRRAAQDRWMEGEDGQEADTEGKEKEEDDAKGSESTSKEPPSRPAHPLSLLLSCRKINLEATVLAFNLHTFTTTTETSFFNLRRSTSHLSRPQFHAISKLACDLGPSYSLNARKASDFLSNCILLFPNVSALVLRNKRPGTANFEHDPVPIVPLNEDFEKMTLRRYVPGWFRTALEDVVAGRGFAWQKGTTWQVEYPQFALPTFETRHDVVRGQWIPQAYMSPETALGDGVRMCVCGCGLVSWVKAFLAQEGGRRVCVEACYYGDIEELRRQGYSGLRVRLREGVPRLPVFELAGGNAILWDADEAYWQRLRDRRGGMLVGLRRCFRQVSGVSGGFLGSREEKVGGD